MDTVGRRLRRRPFCRILIPSPAGSFTRWICRRATKRGPPCLSRLLLFFFFFSSISSSSGVFFLSSLFVFPFFFTTQRAWLISATSVLHTHISIYGDQVSSLVAPPVLTLGWPARFYFLAFAVLFGEIVFLFLWSLASGSCGLLGVVYPDLLQ